MNQLKNLLIFAKKFSSSLNTSFIKIVFIIFYFKIFGNRKFNLKLTYNKKEFWFQVSSRLDLGAVADVFIKQDYLYNYTQNPKIILDLGANIGDTPVFFALLFPEATIFAIEPNPHIQEVLRKNASQFPNIKVFDCAIADKTGKINLNFGESHLGSSINDREQNKNSVEVDVYSLRDFCAKEGISKIDILKFDIEGAEEYLLRDTEFIKQNVVDLAGDMHNDLSSVPLDPLVDKLNLKDVNRNNLINKRYVVFGKLQ